MVESSNLDVYPLVTIKVDNNAVSYGPARVLVLKVMPRIGRL